MGYEKYYCRNIKISDLKYVTQENIDCAHMNITSSEMYDEVHGLNDHFRQMQTVRKKYLVDFWAALLVNFLALIGGTGVFIFEDSMIPARQLRSISLLYRFGGENVIFCMIMAAFLDIIVIYLIFLKKIFNPKIVLLMSAVLVPVNFFFLFTTVMNPIMTNTLGKIDDSIKNDVGYPHFVLLNTSYIRDEEPLEDGIMEEAKKEKTFDDYRIKPEDDNGFL